MLARISGFFHLEFLLIFSFDYLLMDISYGYLARGNISLRKGEATEANMVILMKRCSTSSPISAWQISRTMLRSKLWYWARLISPPLRCPFM